jgi:integrase
MRKKGEHKNLGLKQYQAKSPMGFSCLKYVRWEIDSSGRRTFVYRRRAKVGFSFETEVVPSGTSKEALASDLRKFEEWNRLAAEGIDPRIFNAKPNAIPTFQEVAEEWLETQNGRFKNGGMFDEKTYKNYVGRLKNHLFPKLGNRPIDEITAVEVANCLKQQWHTDTGRRIRWLCEQVCLRAMASEMRDTNFAQKEVIAALLTNNSPTTVHRRYIEVGMVPEVYSNLAKHQNQSALMIRLMLLSCIRVENVVKLEWSWVDFDLNRIVIPAIHTKTKNKDFRQPMTSEVELLLRQQRKISRGEKFVFANQKSRSGHVSSNAPSQWIRNDFNPIYGYDFQPSGLRGTFRRWADPKTDVFPEPVIEETYMHVVGGIKSFYTDRELFEQKKPLIQAWNNYCVGDL